MPTVPLSILSAPADVSSSRSTSRGSIASSEGLCIASSDPQKRVTAKISQSIGFASNELPAITRLPTISPASLSSTIFLRSAASARAPPSMANTRRAATSTRPSRPTSNVLCDSWYTWYGTATNVIMLPKNDTSRPTNSSRKSRCRRSGVMSTVAKCHHSRRFSGSGSSMAAQHARRPVEE